MIELGLIDFIALGFVVFVGLPHGAFDGAVYLQLPHYKKPADLLVFLTLYIAMALAVIGIWYLLPLTSLLLFLALSAFHFGKGDAPALTGLPRAASIIAHGGLATIYLPLMHQEEAFGFFALLTFQQAPQLAAFETLFLGFGALWVLCLGIYAISAITAPHLRRHLLEILGAAIVMAILPLACHSPRAGRMRSKAVAAMAWCQAPLAAGAKRAAPSAMAKVLRIVASRRFFRRSVRSTVSVLVSASHWHSCDAQSRFKRKLQSLTLV